MVCRVASITDESSYQLSIYVYHIYNIYLGVCVVLKALMMSAEEQEELRRSITEDDVINWDITSSGVEPDGAQPLRLVGGVDLSFYEVRICSIKSRQK